jgi:hypothetical protein
MAVRATGTTQATRWGPTMTATVRRLGRTKDSWCRGRPSQWWGGSVTAVVGSGCVCVYIYPPPPPLQYWLFAPELQWQSWGKWRSLQGWVDVQDLGGGDPMERMTEVQQAAFVAGGGSF